VLGTSRPGRAYDPPTVKPIMVVSEILGPSDELLAASDRLAAEVGARDGLLLRLRGTTADGIVVVNVWASTEARSVAKADARHTGARDRSGIAALEQGVRETVITDVRIDPVG
jgi:hypothetical protein